MRDNRSTTPCPCSHSIRATLIARSLAAIAGISVLFTQMARADEPAKERYWAYRPVVRPAVPEVAAKDRVRMPIDAFLLQRLEERKIAFSPPAAKEVLLRRAKFDLLGLPPTPEEIDEFNRDDSPQAFEKLLDRWLASPHYGERWGRMWLDVVRYADSAGFNADPLRPLAYKYRDYVIASFNADVPYDRFVQEQLAGDELFPESESAATATGFLRLPPDESNASDVYLARQDLLNDLTGAVGSIFLAQSFGCAQCHDHKFDEISQADFYRLQAFFAGVIPVDSLPVGSAEEQVAYEQALEEWLKRTDDIRTELHRLEADTRAVAVADKRGRFPESVWAAIGVPVERRNALEHQLAFYTERQLVLPEDQMDKKLSADQKKRRRELQQQLKEQVTQRPKPPRSVEIMGATDGTETPATHLLAGGSYTKPERELQPGFPCAIEGAAEEHAAQIAAPRQGALGRRSALARWLTDPTNPLPARVLVNRVWQAHFGRGLVDNANDFGVQTAPPVHPNLLDWLAAEFVSPTVMTADPQHDAWRIKRLHKLLMLSTVYQQSSLTQTPDAGQRVALEADPSNTLYWHSSRHRLEAEMLRDSLLAVGGVLNPKLFGPPVQPELPPKFGGAWKVSPEGDRVRRSVYILAKRNLPYPMLDSFDFPDMHESCARRPTTTTAPQALMLLNSELVLSYAQDFGGRLLLDHPRGDLNELVADAYRTAYGRNADAYEIAAGAAFLQSQQQLLAARLSRGEAVPLPHSLPKFVDAALGAAVVDFCHALMNANEFAYLD